MIGKELKEFYPKEEVVKGDVVLEVDDLYSGELVRGVSFRLHRGEILGLAGLVGAGRTETMLAMYGVEKIKSGSMKIEGQRQAYASGTAELDASQKQLDDTAAQLAATKAQLSAAEAELASVPAQLSSGQKQINAGWSEIKKQEAKLADGEAEIVSNEAKLADAKQEYEEGKAEAEAEIADGEEKIADAEADIADIGLPKWYVYDRSTLIEYSGFGENAERLGAIGRVFPVLFFLVAALISLTSMTRMVEEIGRAHV